MDKIYESKISLKWGMEAPGIEPGTSRMLSERSTIWATPPDLLSIGNKIIVWRARPKSFLDNSFLYSLQMYTQTGFLFWVYYLLRIFNSNQFTTSSSPANTPYNSGNTII